MSDTIEATKSMPPKPEARKANPINKEYEDRPRRNCARRWFIVALRLNNWLGC